MVGSRYRSLEEWAFRKHLMLAVVFTDIVGSTSLRKELGDETMATITQRHFAKARYYINQYDGYEIKTIGDEVMAVFPTAVDALNYTLDLYADTGHDKIQIRAAIHVGTVSVVNGDIDATMASLAARISKLPRGATIYVSEDAQVQIKQVKSQRHTELSWLRKKVQVKDFQEINSVWLVLTPKMRQENRKRALVSTREPASSGSVPSRPSLTLHKRVTLPPPPGAELRKSQATTQPDWWKILVGKSDSMSGENNLLAALLRNDPEKRES